MQGSRLDKRETTMAERSPFRRFQHWGEQHPWLNFGLVLLFGVALVLLVPPRDSLNIAVLKVISWCLLYLGLNWLLYRSFLPSRARYKTEEAKADQIAAAVRRAREQDSTL
jgi:hypothetical protein